MKSIKPTRSKTRIGVLNWLAKLNPFFTKTQQAQVFNREDIIAVHVNRFTGAIVYFEDNQGNLLPFSQYHEIAA